MNGSELLHEAGVRVAAGWCQNAEARTSTGSPVDVLSERAVEWSLLGALQSAACADDSTRIEDIADAVAAIAQLILDPSLANWNDEPFRTKREVDDLLRRAELLAASEPSALEERVIH